MMNDFPRILLLTPADPDFPYAGGEVLRKITGALPYDSIVWAYLKEGTSHRPKNIVASQSFPCKQWHWRLKNSSAALLYRREIEARKRAAMIAEWAKQFNPQVLWVLAEEEAVNVAFCLKDILKIPMHLTFHDAPEIFAKYFTASSWLPRRLYVQKISQLIEGADGVDAVSRELLNHMVAFSGRYDFLNNLVLPPSSSKSNSQYDVTQKLSFDNNKRKFGFCGAPRVSEEQWKDFLSILGNLPFDFELIVFTDKESFFKTDLPSNVAISMQSYAETEHDLIDAFVNHGVHACYLGLWKDKGKELFYRTSLSSKLATYAAAGIPVLMDGPVDSVAWRILSRYDAGVHISVEQDNVATLFNLLSDIACWRRISCGVENMWEHEFNLSKTAESLKKAMYRYISGVFEK